MVSKSQRRKTPAVRASSDPGSQLVDAVTSQVAAVRSFVESAAEDLRCAAQSSVPVLITAGSGLERESLARLIHRGSRRRGGPFMAIRCDVQRVDNLDRLVETAGGGTVFLDEIGAMRKSVQNALYALFARDARSEPEEHGRVDVRIITGSSRSLRSQVTGGTFGEDLFYRLNVIHIVPADQRSDAGSRRGPIRSQRPRGPNVFPRALDE